jgi:hypothetical protein
LSPDHFDARHLLAIVCHQRGRTAEAIDLLATALRSSQFSLALSNYGLMLQALRLRRALRDRAGGAAGFASAQQSRDRAGRASGVTHALASYDRRS